MEIKVYEIHMACGKSDNWVLLEELTKENIQILNDIGSGLLKISRVNYLNSINPKKYQYQMYQTKYDTGDWCQTFLVIRVKL